jgi:single-strand DNA-binding protein
MLNKVILMGRLTADLELKQTPSNIAVVSFTLAVERNYTPKGTEKQADFINIVAWRHTAEFVAKYFAKGQLLAVEGSIQTRNYTDKDGNKRYVTEVVAEQVYFAEKRPSGSANGPSSFTPNSDFSDNKAPSFTTGDIGDFEEIDTGDGELPF